MAGRVLASSPTGDGLRALVARRLFADVAAVSLVEGGGVSVAGKPMAGWRWRTQRGRWRLEEA